MSNMEATLQFDPKNGGKRAIYRPFITTKDGRKIWAKSYGKRAFRIEIDPDDKDES